MGEAEKPHCIGVRQSGMHGSQCVKNPWTLIERTMAVAGPLKCYTGTLLDWYSAPENVVGCINISL